MSPLVKAICDSLPAGEEGEGGHGDGVTVLFLPRACLGPGSLSGGVRLSWRSRGRDTVAARGPTRGAVRWACLSVPPLYAVCHFRTALPDVVIIVADVIVVLVMCEVLEVVCGCVGVRGGLS